MIPIRDDLIFRQRAILTLTLVGLIAVLYFWDREGRIWGASIAFADLAMRPGQITDVLRGQGDPVDLSRLFTSIFLHANLPHMVTNVVFLFAFGPSVEAALGGVRFALFYLFWGVVAFLAQIQAAPESMVPVLGASGAIGGVLGSYFLLFPGNNIKLLIIPFLWRTFVLPAWVLLAFWFATQLLVPQEGVATWAHAGGFLAGMATVLVLGGRNAILKDLKYDTISEFDED